MTANKAGIRLTLDDGTDLAKKIDPRFLELTLVEKRGGEADELSLTLHNHDGQLKAPETGRYIRLALGWESGDDVTIGLVDKGRFASTKWKKADHPTRSRSAPARPTSPAPAASDG
jgi:phage protein D